MTNKNLTLVAIAVAEPGKERELRAAQEKLVEATLKEPGCIRYELHQSLEDPRVLVFFETWASEDAWRAHMDGQAIRRFQESGAGEWIAEFTLHRMGMVAGG